MKPFQLQRYASASGMAGVQAFALLPGGILIQFRSGEAYLYDEVQPGQEHVVRMQQLARQGRGLSTYISRHVQDRYRLKLSRQELQRILREVTQPAGPEA